MLVLYMLIFTTDVCEVIIMLYSIESSTCVSAFITPDFIREQSLLITEREDIGNPRQLIYPDMDFRCNGTITKWVYGGTMGTGNEKPELQTWRRIRDDMYVKQNFSQVIFNKTNSTNVHEFYLTNPIEFNEGDVFGLYQPDNNELVLFAQRNSGPNNYRVDANIDQASTSLVLSELRLEWGNDFPLVSLEISIGKHIICITILMLNRKAFYICILKFNFVSIDDIDAPSSFMLTETSNPLIPGKYVSLIV